MPVNKATIESKLGKIRTQIAKIEALKFTQQEFLANSLLQDGLIFCLIQAVEAAIDIGTHLTSALELPRMETAREVFDQLGAQKILSAQIVSAMKRAIGFRNFAIHEYEESTFNIESVFHHYPQDIADLRLFMAEVTSYLEKQ